MSNFNGAAGAGLVFLILYFAVFLWLLFAYLTHRIKWRSRWSALFFHVMGFRNKSSVNWFIAYLVLGAEGYFTLVLCTFRFVISWHQHNIPSGVSWLEPRRGAGPKLDRRARTRRMLTFLFLGPFALLLYRDNIMASFHLVLILANTAIVIGGSYLANANILDSNSADTQRRLRISRISRTTGQSVFLACNTALLVILLITVRNDRRVAVRKGGVHPTLMLLLLAWIPLIIRGVFGVIQSADFELSYYNVNNYTLDGFTSHYTLVEYLMGVTTEWLACVLLSCTYFTSKNDPPKPPITPAGETAELRERDHVTSHTE
ncbi:hypothetical protein MVEN_01690500 [Mycena venus]|uniref:Uncharacterized protein n=1 Tax=Mycena venus TaxID=2733690 RepID=A0A8H6XP43_9AGAR|nr:hypothetical protein MVEN_01690500 [Mycena venus]